MESDQRSNSRRKFRYYLPVVEYNTLEIFGYLVDISATGFRLEVSKPHGVTRDYFLRIDLPQEISLKPYISFTARVMWVRPDSVDPNTFHEGYQIIKISPADEEIFTKMMSLYSKPSGSI